MVILIIKHNSKVFTMDQRMKVREYTRKVKRALQEGFDDGMSMRGTFWAHGVVKPNSFADVVRLTRHPLPKGQLVINHIERLVSQGDYIDITDTGDDANDPLFDPEETDEWLVHHDEGVFFVYTGGTEYARFATHIPEEVVQKLGLRERIE